MIAAVVLARRGGRMLQNEAQPQPRAWLEIQGSGSSQGNSVSVGEHTTMLVKTWLPGQCA